MLRHKTYQCKVNYFGGEECKIILALHPGDFWDGRTTTTKSSNYLSRGRQYI